MLMIPDSPKCTQVGPSLLSALKRMLVGRPLQSRRHGDAADSALLAEALRDAMELLGSRASSGVCARNAGLGLVLHSKLSVSVPESREARVPSSERNVTRHFEDGRKTETVTKTCNGWNPRSVTQTDRRTPCA